MADKNPKVPFVAPAQHFIRTIIKEDLANNKNNGKVVTRFPPEPNGNLHIGHAKSICLNFGMAREFDGICYLRFDDTNPTKEEIQYMEGIKDAVRWLGFNWEDRLTHSSDYFDRLYALAIELIKRGKAYVCSLSPKEASEYKGDFHKPGKNSPYRERTVEENLDLLERMRKGEFQQGEHVLRAKIDMASPNMVMRDPVLYRIMHKEHQMTGDKWKIYPMYDFTHCLSDSIEGVTHSLCTLEFVPNRELYDWVLDALEMEVHPQQIEFSKLNLEYTITSKRRLNQLVTEGHVDGWDDPRMPTIIGMKRRGVPPAAIRDFCERVGVTKKENTVEMSLLENSVRDELEANAPRAMAVIKPLKITITNYPEGQTEQLHAPVHPKKEELGQRTFEFSRNLYIEQEDFEEVPPKKFKRLIPGGLVRLRYAYIIQCDEIIRDEQGEITELLCTYFPDTKSGAGTSTIKAKGVIHWLSETDSVPAEVRLYDRLFNVPSPAAGEKEGVSFTSHLNPESLEICEDARVEASLVSAEPEKGYQFERMGYFCRDNKPVENNRPVFNRTVTLRDSWAKIEKEQHSQKK